ncbi:F-box only protein 36 [Platysternon megacephalum]|uniref:F-box only protein 36 n=1 Tax=Platysternon megacephalum TaxID=55544 RepID=A0A4D9E2S5_9SAUR|nr:F-box only protein 36 [Platysternon megacephalum]
MRPLRTTAPTASGLALGTAAAPVPQQPSEQRAPGPHQQWPVLLAPGPPRGPCQQQPVCRAIPGPAVSAKLHLNVLSTFWEIGVHCPQISALSGQLSLTEPV